MEYSAYIISCQTNMHVGSGDTNFGVVDNLVQRDPVTGHPTIHSSSLKGALREYFGEKISNDHPEYIFGSPSNAERTTQGNYGFFSAKLLSIPVRSDIIPYFMATSPDTIQNMLSDLDTFKIKLKDATANEALKNISTMKAVKQQPLSNEADSASIENFCSQKAQIPDVQETLGENIAIFHCEDFKEITKYLPVVARNNLENGESKNLWYEEIVPAMTRFVFIVGKGEKHQDIFDKALSEGIIQIGANASIGYGYTKIKKISE
jgi:CRISPR-associated protein Cmr4